MSELLNAEPTFLPTHPPYLPILPTYPPRNSCASTRTPAAIPNPNPNPNPNQLCINENPGCQFIVTNLDAVTHLTDAQVRLRSPNPHPDPKPKPNPDPSPDS